MRWARANVKPVAIAERNEYHRDEAGQNARSIIEMMKMEAERLEQQAQREVDGAIRKEAASHTKRWIASVKAGANVDVSFLLRDDDLIDLLAIKSEQFNGLIRNLSQDVLNRIERETLGAIFEGRSNADIAKSLQEIEGIGRNRAKLIARDQASKLNGALNQFRQEQAGITHYRWRSMMDPPRARELHMQYNGKIFAWEKPPPGGPPGQLINCRCRGLAVIPDDETGDPTPASQQEVTPEVDYGAVEPLIQRVGLTPTKNVFSWTAEEIASRATDLDKVQAAVSALKAQPTFDVKAAETLTTAVYGYLPSDDALVGIVGEKVRSLFERRRTLLFRAVSERLDLISRLLAQAMAARAAGN